MRSENIKKWMTGSFLALGLTMGCSNAGEQLPRYEGEIQLFAVDHADGTHRMGYGLRTADGQSFELSFDGEPQVQAGDRVVIHGYLAPERAASAQPGQVGEVLQAESIEVLPASAASKEGLATSSDALVGGTPRTIRVAVLPLVFPGSTAGIDNATAKQRLATVRSYYQEISYGTWIVEGDALAPLTLARPANCNLDTINNAARAAAKSQGINLDVYAHVGFVIPNNSGLSNCACGLAWVGRPPASSSPSIGNGSLYTCTDANAFAHEFGHGFGLNHASTARCGTGVAYKANPYSSCTPDEYGNRFNTMGGGLGHMNAFQKSAMKWLDKCNTLRVSKSGTFEVTAIHTASNATQALQIPNGDNVGGRPLYYWVEYRNPALATFNSGATGAGVHVGVAQDFRSADGDTRPLLLDLAPGYPNNHQDPRLTAGRTFQDPNGIAISVLEQNNDRAVVQVTFPGGGSGTNVCADSSVPGTTAPQAGGTYQLTAAHSGKCLDVSNSGTADGSNIQQWDCNGTNAQAFRLETSGAGYRLVNINSGKCVDVASSGTTDGANIQLYTCNGTNAQAFRLQQRTDGKGYNLANVNSSKCAEVAGSSTASGANVQQWSCNNGLNQAWTFSTR
ncbi:Metallo-peptidase family M12 [Stigmatella erecta]|uniref:Metallo-peptidase family M12 n=2 Tax=Stigmatella erecta TaxID=83460 RepID=A0A1I0IWM6_9BACT|nr:Metallo-peptidase family M12 [Stigmatella erecta]